jgi:hypothetical protein
MRAISVLVVVSAIAFAQSSPPQSTSPGVQPGNSVGAAKPAPSTPDRSNAQTTVPADIKEVRRNLEALKTAVGKMDDGPAHDAAEQNVKFLDSLVSYLEHQDAMRQGGMSQRPRSRRTQPMQGPQGVAGENPKEPR